MKKNLEEEKSNYSGMSAKETDHDDEGSSNGEDEESISPVITSDDLIVGIILVGVSILPS